MKSKKSSKAKWSKEDKLDRNSRKAYWRSMSRNGSSAHRNERARDRFEKSTLPQVEFYSAKQYPETLPPYWIAFKDGTHEYVLPRQSKKYLSVQEVEGKEGRIIVILRGAQPVCSAVYFRGAWTLFRNLLKDPSTMPSFANKFIKQIRESANKELGLLENKKLLDGLEKF